jgi:hypothetical protein
MSSFSPTTEGFRLIFRRPEIPLAEIAWRWSFAVAAWLLGIVFLLEYMGSLPVDAVDRLLLASQQPSLAARAIHRIFHGSAFRFTEAGIPLLVGLAIAWIALASLGRAATLAALLEEFGIERRSGGRSGGGTVRSLFALNSLRAAVTLAAVVAAAGCALLASSLWASTHASIADSTRLWFGALFLVWLVWTFLNWLLSVAAIFAATDQEGSLNAIASTARFCREHTGEVLAAGIWFGLPHLGACIAAFLAGVTALSTVGTWRMGPALVLELLIVLGYCGVADFLYTGRLAAYVAIVRGDELERGVLALDLGVDEVEELRVSLRGPGHGNAPQGRRIRWRPAR